MFPDNLYGMPENQSVLESVLGQVMAIKKAAIRYEDDPLQMLKIHI